MQKTMTFYFDVTPGMDLNGFHLAATAAGELEQGVTRYTMTVNVDDGQPKRSSVVADTSIVDGPLQNSIIWRPCDMDAGNYRPDAEMTVLIYDGYLDDVVMGYLDTDDSGDCPIWYGETTGDPLPDPQLWSDLPFPEIIPPVKIGTAGR